MAASSVQNSMNKFTTAIAQYNVQFKKSIQTLKEHQQKALESLLNGKDCICCLPTGYGKYIVYELLPFLDEGCLVVVIVPLNAIMEQQLQKLSESAISLGPGFNTTTLKTGNFSYIFSHPEQIIDNPTLKEIFCLDVFQMKKVYLVIDEAHCILEWGDSFRGDYQKLYQLRSVFDCQVLALSATITEEGRKKIAKHLLMKDFAIVNGNPAKDNIVLIVEKRPSPTAKGCNATTPYNYIFEPIILKLLEEMDNFPITIIYCKSLQWLGHGYEMARRLLGDKFYSGTRSPENARVVMYHSSMEKESGKLKNFILTSLQKPEEECHVKLIFASVALGMGADLKNVRRVIHAGPPTCLETYIQEIGRAGRSDSSAEAILYFNNSDVAQKSMRQEMKNYCTDKQRCRRDLMNAHFGFQDIEKPKICCNYCDTQLGLCYDFSQMHVQ